MGEIRNLSIWWSFSYQNVLQPGGEEAVLCCFPALLQLLALIWPGLLGFVDLLGCKMVVGEWIVLAPKGQIYPYENG